MSLRLARHFPGDGFVVDKYVIDIVSPCPKLGFFVVEQLKGKKGKSIDRRTDHGQYCEGSQRYKKVVLIGIFRAPLRDCGDRSYSDTRQRGGYAECTTSAVNISSGADRLARAYKIRSRRRRTRIT
jgi:hypothetical protein